LIISKLHSNCDHGGHCYKTTWQRCCIFSLSIESFFNVGACFINTCIEIFSCLFEPVIFFFQLLQHFILRICNGHLIKIYHISSKVHKKLLFCGWLWAMCWRVLRPCLAILSPAWRTLLEFFWTRLKFLIWDMWIVPVEASKMEASSLHSLIVNFITFAALVWILTMDHPITACLWVMKCWLIWLYLVTSIWDTWGTIVKSWSSNIEMCFTVAWRVSWWAIVCTF